MSELSLPDALGSPPKIDGSADAQGEALGGVAPSRLLESLLLRFLARVIHSDASVAPPELSMLVEVAVALGLTGAEARRILDEELVAKSDCAVLAAQLPGRARRREAYAMGCMMALADGAFDDAEKTVLADFARGSAFTEAEAKSILDGVLAVRGLRGDKS